MNINIVPDDAIARVHVSQYDIGRSLSFNLFNGATAYDIPSGAVVKIQGTKPSGFGFSEECTIDGSTVTIATTEAMTDEYGKIATELSITNGNTVLGTSNFVLVVEESPHKEGTTDGSAEALIPELTLLVNEVRGYAEEIEGTYHAYGSPWVASTVSEMTDTDKIYVYVGNETGYTNGNWYYYNGTSWASGGVYNSVAVQTDTTLSVSGMPADAGAVGDTIGDLSELETEVNSNIVEAINWLFENGGSGEPPVKYTITNNLKNVSNSNGATSIRENRAYTATLSLTEGATLGTVSITMGGTDITQTAWNSTNMTISIASVTNDVVITAKASVVEVVEATWSQFGAATRYGTQVIDATEKDVHVIVQFDEESQYIAEGATSESIGVRIMAALYSDEEAETLVGYWYNNQINSSYTSTTAEELPFDSEWICPLGYYVKIVTLKISSSIFTSNNNFFAYIRDNTVITLVEHEEEEETEMLSNAQMVDRDLLQMYSLNAVSLTTDTVEDSTSYEGVLEEAKNAWMTEYGGNINKIPLIIHTDQHSYMTVKNSKDMWDAIDNMVSWYDLSKVINLGDTTNSFGNYSDPVLGDGSLEAYLEATENVPFSKRIEVFGNHDVSGMISSALNYIQQAPSYLNPYFKNVMARRTSNNGYHVTYDPYFNVKYIVYSNYDYVDSSNYDIVSAAQYDFLIEEMTKNDGYDIIMLGHQDANIYQGYVHTLVKARYNKTSGTFTAHGVSHTYDFTNCENELLVCLHGHNHNDNYNYDMDVLSQCFDRYYDSKRPIFFVIVDRENNQLKVWKVMNTPEYTTYTRPFIEASNN